MLFLRYEPSIHQMVIGDAIIEDAEVLANLPMRWKTANRKARKQEKRDEWDKLVIRVGTHNLWEWHEEHVHEYMEIQSDLFLPVKEYRRYLDESARWR